MRHLLTKIDTIEFPNWQSKSIKSLKMWIDVLSEKWICFGCNGLALKRAPFCHHACSYTKREK